jgi:hypothetical protein
MKPRRILGLEGATLLKDKWLVERDNHAPCIRISTIQKWYVFPWSHFVYAEGDNDEVKVAFITHNITFKGKGLWSLLDALQNRTLIQIETSERTAKFEKPNNEPLVFEIIIDEVKGKQ